MLLMPLRERWTSVLLDSNISAMAKAVGGPRLLSDRSCVRSKIEREGVSEVGCE